MTHIYGSDLQSLAKDNSKKRLFIDVRSTEEFRQGSIQGFKNIPLHLLPLKMNDLSKESQIVLLCASGSRSMQAAMYLSQQGYHDIVNVRGGIMSI